MKRLGLFSAALLSCGCTFEDGTGFATLERAELSVALVPGEARDLGDGSLLTDKAYELRLETAVIRLEVVELKELSGGGGGGGSFDPANPPPGYSNCHSGHCHAADGSLATFEEIQTELAGGAASFVPIVSCAVPEPLDLWSGERVLLEQGAPSTELPRANVQRLSITVSELELRGEASAGPAVGGIGATPVPLEIVLPIAAAFEKSFELEITRDEPGKFSLAVDVVVTARLFDGIEWSALVTEGALSLTDPEDPAALTLVGSLLASEVRVTIE
jgi:hypothetical protein